MLITSELFIHQIQHEYEEYKGVIYRLILGKKITFVSIKPQYKLIYIIILQL